MRPAEGSEVRRRGAAAQGTDGPGGDRGVAQGDEDAGGAGDRGASKAVVAQGTEDAGGAEGRGQAQQRRSGGQQSSGGRRGPCSRGMGADAAGCNVATVTCG